MIDFTDLYSGIIIPKFIVVSLYKFLGFISKRLLYLFIFFKSSDLAFG